MSSAVRGGSRADAVSVDAEGLTARSRRELVLDVLFDGRRIWSLWLHRDGEERGADTFVAWPKGLRRFLDGSTRVTVLVHGTDRVLYEAEHQFGTGSERLDIVDRDGNPLATDKSGRLTKTFENRTAEHVAPLIDAIDEVLTALRRAGIEAFLAYGTLLGAVRAGALIGHDSDADLGYVSRHAEPVDVIRESFRLQASLAQMGYVTHRYSGAAFKVLVKEADGSVRGLDVFGGFLRDGDLYLMGEIRAPFREEWIFPLGTARLEGREFPVPADPDRLLVATYGPSWRTPDPAYKFETPSSTYRRLNGWFRGLRPQRSLWDGIYARTPEPPGHEPSDLVTSLFAEYGTSATYVDLGCGYGVDVAWLAGQGARVWGLDHVPRAFTATAEMMGEGAGGGEARFLALNLHELRSVLSTGALIARDPGPRVLIARHLVDAVDRPGRRNLYRLCDMLLRDGGALHLELVTGRGTDRLPRRIKVKVRSLPKILAELKRAGATVTDQQTLLASVPEAGGEVQEPSQISRMVATWRR